MVMIAAGVSGILAQAVLMPLLMRFLGESYIIIFGTPSPPLSLGKPLPQHSSYTKDPPPLF